MQLVYAVTYAKPRMAPVLSNNFNVIYSNFKHKSPERAKSYYLLLSRRHKVTSINNS